MGRYTRTTHTRTRAFSLVELVIILVVVGILSSVAVPRLSNVLDNRRADAAGRRIAVDLAFAQRQAMRQNDSQKIQFDLVNDKYWLEGVGQLDRTTGDYTVVLTAEPYNATLTSGDFDGDLIVIFDVFGMPDSGGSVVVRSGIQTRTVTLEAETGKASMQ